MTYLRALLARWLLPRCIMCRALLGPDSTDGCCTDDCRAAWWAYQT